jgi:3-hydroxybutyryl-CoA dehydrogenase
MSPKGVIGAGTMGSGIALISAVAGCEVVLCDISEDALHRALAGIKEDLAAGVGKGKYTAEKASFAQGRIRTTSSFEQFASCDIVIEAASEHLVTKQDLFKRLEAVCGPETMLATNTSSLSVTSIASAMRHPRRVVGMHFFNPPHIMKLVEIIQGDQTADTVLRQATEFARFLGKVPVTAKDTPGFIVNRVARPFYGEALRILGEGIATAAEIDRIVKESGGFKMGPFELMDLIGIDINLAVTKSMYEQTFGEERYRPHIIQQTMVNAGKLGRKTKQGFYTYGS